MMDKQKGKWVFECDTCGTVYESGTGDFDLAQLKRKEEGWVAFKSGDEWQHKCDRCR